jgi:ATP-binding cassette subfamily C (CFTR/MRP) protein 1
MNCSLLGPDDVFGPVVLGCRGDFDFTLLFEQSMLTTVPSTMLLIAVPIKILQLYGASVKIQSTPLSQIKLVNKNPFMSACRTVHDLGV